MSGKDREKTEGFGALGAIIVVLVALFIGLIGWRIYDANKPQRSATTAPSQTEGKVESTQEAPAVPNDGYVVIKEWGVRFKPVDGLVGVVYSADKDNQAMSFSTLALAEYGDSCIVEKMPLGRLIKTKGSKEDAQQLNTAHAVQVNDAYYQYLAPQAICSENEAAIKLQTDTINLFRQAVRSLEAAK